MRRIDPRPIPAAVVAPPTAPAIKEWVRPFDWLYIPALGAQEFIGLIAVENHDSNYVALLFEGAYTVDWGDGVVENFAANVQAEHLYNYSSLSAGSLSSRGYRQALVRVTPQSGQNLTTINLFRKHSRAGLSTIAPSFWLEWHCNLPNATSATLSSSATTTTRHRMVERAVISLPAATNCSNLLQSCTSLQSVSLSLPAATNCSSLLSGCNSLQSVSLSLPVATTCTNILNNCTALQSVNLSLPAATTCSTLLAGSTSLQSVSLSLPAATTCTNLLFGCTSLQSVSLSLPVATTCNSLLQSCTALQSVNLNLPAATSCSSLLSGCTALQSVNLNLPAATSCSSLLSGCTSLQSVSLNLPAATSCSSLLSGCTSLQSVSLSLPVATTCSSLLNACSSLQSVNLSLPAATTCSNLLAACTSLQSVNLSLPAVTSCTSLLNGCSSLQSVNISGLQFVTGATSMFPAPARICRAQVEGLQIAHSYASNALARAQLVEIFNLLGTANGAQALTITGNHGVADLTMADLDIAFLKGWTVIE